METPISIYGKQIFVYEPERERRYTSEHISRYTRRFQLNAALRLIGELSHEISNKDEPIFQGVFNGILAYLAMRLIETSNDYRSKEISRHDIVALCEMYFGLSDPIVNDQQFDPCLIRFGAIQFDYERDSYHPLSRTLLLYRDLWRQTPEACQVNIEDAIRSVSGLGIENILLLGFGFYNIAEKGFIRVYDPSSAPNPSTKRIFTQENQQNFLG